MFVMFISATHFLCNLIWQGFSESNRRGCAFVFIISIHTIHTIHTHNILTTHCYMTAFYKIYYYHNHVKYGLDAFQTLYSLIIIVYRPRDLLPANCFIVSDEIIINNIIGLTMRAYYMKKTYSTNKYQG